MNKIILGTVLLAGAAVAGGIYLVKKCNKACEEAEKAETEATTLEDLDSDGVYPCDGDCEHCGCDKDCETCSAYVEDEIAKAKLTANEWVKKAKQRGAIIAETVKVEGNKFAKKAGCVAKDVTASIKKNFSETEAEEATADAETSEPVTDVFSNDNLGGVFTDGAPCGDSDAEALADLAEAAGDPVVDDDASNWDDAEDLTEPNDILEDIEDAADDADTDTESDEDPDDALAAAILEAEDKRDAWLGDEEGTEDAELLEDIDDKDTEGEQL